MHVVSLGTAALCEVYRCYLFEAPSEHGNAGVKEGGPFLYVEVDPFHPAYLPALCKGSHGLEGHVHWPFQGYPAGLSCGLPHFRKSCP